MPFRVEGVVYVVLLSYYVTMLLYYIPIPGIIGGGGCGGCGGIIAPFKGERRTTVIIFILIFCSTKRQSGTVQP